MIGIAKTVDDDTDQQRNAWGFPPVEVTAHPSSSQTARVDVDNSNRKNDALPWVLVVGVIAAVALGMWISSEGRIDDQAIATAQMIQTIRDAHSHEIDTMREQHSRDLGKVQQQADLLTYYVMELDGKLMQRRLLKPEESFSGQMRQREQAKQQAEKPKE